MARDPYAPGGARDPFRDTALNGHLLAMVDADVRHRGRLSREEAIALEGRRAFATFPRPCWQMHRIRECLRQLGLSDDDMRQLWRERGEQ